jgi:hypothetical protein
MGPCLTLHAGAEHDDIRLYFSEFFITQSHLFYCPARVVFHHNIGQGNEPLGYLYPFGVLEIKGHTELSGVQLVVTAITLQAGDVVFVGWKPPLAIGPRLTLYFDDFGAMVGERLHPYWGSGKKAEFNNPYPL